MIRGAWKLTDRRETKFVLAFLLFTVATWAAPTQAEEAKPCAAAPCCCPERPHDEIWIVSSRCLGCQTGPILDRLQYWKLVDHTWTRMTQADYFSPSAGEFATVMFAHGNRIESGQDRWVAETAHHSIACCAPASEKMRFVLWSWPADKIPRHPRQDVRAKAHRSDIEAYYLAQFIAAHDSTKSVGLIGYSFGARIITGAEHLLGGGQICGRRLADTRSNHPPLRTVLLAAALDNHWLMPGHRHGKAVGEVESLLAINNGCDRVLRQYHRMYGRRSCAEALGYTGIAGLNTMGDDRAKISQYDACCVVGPQHDWTHYFGSNNIRSRMCAALFGTK